jgi:hypothetical protein
VKVAPSKTAQAEVKAKRAAKGEASTVSKRSGAEAEPAKKVIRRAVKKAAE